jgi:DNA-binding transcriptional ArsR family regulator
MRKVPTRGNKAVLDTMFSKIRQGILGTIFREPSRWWFTSEMARYLGTSPSSLERELPALAKAEILQCRREKGRTYFKAKTASPIYEHLRAIFNENGRMKNRSHVTHGRSLARNQAKPRQRKPFPYPVVAKLWAQDKSIAQIAHATGYVDRGKKAKFGPYHTLRRFLNRMHNGYRDSSGKIVKLPHRVSARTVHRARQAGRRTASGSRQE